MRPNHLSLSAACARLGRWRRHCKTLLCLALAPAGLGAQTFLAEWSTPDIGRLGPTGLATDSEGGRTIVYVADEIHGRILKFDAASGARLAAWGETGTGDLQFNRPFGLAIEPATHDLFVAERGNNRVQRITRNGAFVTKWGVLGTAAGEFDAPVGVAVDAAGHVFVSDYHNHRIQKFLVQGAQVQHVATWGGEGTAEGKFRGPYGIALDPAGNLWVADAMNHRLQKFDASGAFLGATGSFGTGNGQFITPTWVTFDASGAYYVCETNSDPQNLAAADIAQQRIQKFSASGAFLLKWGTLGENGGQFRMPLALALDGAGDAFVSDYYNTRVQKFSLDGSGGPPTGNPPGATAGARFVNLSSRLRTADGDASRAFIAGFVVGGTAAKPMLIRAVGPALGGFGVPGALANPKLRLYRGDQLIAENDDWGTGAGAAGAAGSVGAFPLSDGSRDAALVISLAPGTYSAQVVANGGDGVGLVEVYDADTAQPATQLINLSTRGFVDTGAGVLVAGFVINGTEPKRVLVRGVGPALVQFGVSGALADPQLKLMRGDTLVAQNDNWASPQTTAGGATVATAAEISAAATAVGAFALSATSKDAAVLVTLPAGAYSAVVSGANNTTGAGLVEVYEVRTN
jgi:sugar lactone lactonase YvrE